MDFKKKLKTRLYLAIAYIIIGVAMTVIFNVLGTENEYLSSFGVALAVVGIVRLRNYLIVTKSEERIRKQEIAETDERNIAIASRARTAAFYVYTLLACIAVIVLQILEIGVISTVIACSVCALILIYWVSYFIIRKKS